MPPYVSVAPQACRRSVLNDRLTVSLEDTELMSEVLLTVELMIAASEATAPLERQTIDRLLGL
jgi:hypothetical protein